MKENNGKSSYIVKITGYDFKIKWGCEIKQETDGDANSTPWSGISFSLKEDTAIFLCMISFKYHYTDFHIHQYMCIHLLYSFVSQLVNNGFMHNKIYIKGLWAIGRLELWVQDKGKVKIFCNI